MKKQFKEYHQHTENEFQSLWDNCLFVFDTNTLLNMYRYSRETVKIYLDVLTELKNKKQLWIPYQVGYEFYENRINLISEYEQSYDFILKILDKAKKEIESKYKDHPFLDILKIKEEMSSVEGKILKAKEEHPKWLEKDEVLDSLNKVFDGNVGNEYEKKRLDEIKQEGRNRYEKKIPPGFKDDDKPEERKYGDLILWFQIIDKATESKRPIILISGDIKEDWWLQKDGRRLMPLPQLRKEIFEKGGVDFHIYTADQFLKHYTDGATKKIDDKAIKEVRKISELEEQRMLLKRMELMVQEKIEPILRVNLSAEYLHTFEMLHALMISMRELEIPHRYSAELDQLFQRITDLRDRIAHGNIDRMSFDKFYSYTKEILFILYKIVRSDEIPQELALKYRNYIDRLEHMTHRLRGFFNF